MISIRAVDEADLPYIANIHKRSYSPEHITSHYPINLLVRFYGEISKGNDYCYVAIDDNKIVGFLFAGNKTRVAVNSFISQNYFNIGLVVLRHPSFILSSIKGFIDRFLTKKSSGRSGITLLSISVDPLSMKKGVGKKMLIHFENNLKKNHYSIYGLSVRKSNSKAISFYKKNKFRVFDEYENSIAFEKQL